MENKTVKQLQDLCRQAGLKTSGRKKDLIERLEFKSAHNSVNQQLVDRINELEQTVARLETRSPSSAADEDSPLRTNTFVPTGASSPRNDAQVNVTTAHMPITNNVPIVSSVHIPNTMNTSMYAQAPTVTPIVTHQHSSNFVRAAPVPTYTQQGPWYTQPGNPPVYYVATPMTAVPQVQNNMLVPNMNINDIVAVLPEYDPTSDESLTSTQFVQRVQMLKNAYNWRDDLVILAVQRKLKGYAKSWADSQTVIFVNWNQFAEKIIQAFPFDENAASAHLKMSRAKRQVNETPINYYFRMFAMGNRYGIDESAIARHIINGVNDQDLRRKISNDYMSCGDLLRDIESYCRYNEVKINTGRYKQDTVVNERDKTNNMDKHIKCYNCGKYGHVAAKCRAPKRTGGYVTTGRQETVRQNKDEPRNIGRNYVNTVHTEDAAEPEMVENNVNVVLTENMPKPEIMKSVKINNCVFMALIDPGSSHSLIRSSCAANLGTPFSCNVPLAGFGGGKYVCSTMVSVVLQVDDHEVAADLLLVDNHLIQHDILIGRNIICQNGTRLIIEDNTCWIEGVGNVSSCAKELTKAEYQELKTIINQFKGCFANKIEELGTCSIKKMQIKLISDKPINMKPYRIAFAQRPKVREMIEELLRANIIRQSVSPYASPIVVVPKKTGEIRLCVDYRQINKITEREPYPMPVIDEHLAQLAGNKFFTTMDLRMGYHQVEVEEESRKYTAFVTTEGHFEYIKMPFGLVNAPAVFQSIINNIVDRMEPGEILAYLDDIVIPSKTVESGLQRLKKFLMILSEAGLTLRLDKCNFLTTQITYLGHEVSAEGITPGEQKINAVKNFPVPTNITEVRRFLGLVGFFRKFIRDCALISRPLTLMLHKSEAGNFSWGEAQEMAFRKLIKILCEKPLLALYDFNAQHEVHTDASSVGLAGVLLQSYDKKSWRPVLYFSRQCTESESHYHAYEQETLAVVETLSRFRIYLLGKPFTLVTDCSAIAKAKEKKELIPKIARWYMRLLEFDCEMVHRAGHRLAHVDALSRAPTESPCEMEMAGFVMNVNVGDQDWLLTMQLQDPKLSHIISVLNGETKSDQESQIQTDYKLQNSRLFRKKNGLKLVVPKNVRWRIAKLCHDDVGHFALEKTIERIEQTFWFPRIRKYVREYIAACIQCCYNKARGGKHEGQLHFSDVEPIPFVSLHLDHLGPFIKSTKGMSYILVIVDAFSKYVVLKAVRTTKTLPVITALNDLTTYFGLPKRLITDRGTAFTSNMFENYCAQNNIQHIKTAVRSPRANGQAERANQLILNFLRTTVDAARKWDEHLRDLQWSINTQKNATSGFTPNQLIFDFNLRDVIHNQMLAAVHKDDEPDLSMNEKRVLAAQRIKEARNRWKKRFDDRHKHPNEYKINDLVVVAYEPASTGDSRKLEPKFRGPYMIAKVLPKDRYVITDISGMQVTQRHLNTVYAADKLQRWCNDSPELANDSNDEAEYDQTFEGEARSGRAELSSEEEEDETTSQN